MKVISLMESTAIDKKLAVSHGISFYIELFDRKIIFDTGDSPSVISNAKKLGVPVREITDIVLSHNHLAHTGGADAFLKLSPRARLFMKADARGEFFVKGGLMKKNISLPETFFKKHAKRMILINNFTQVSDRFFLASNEEFDERLANIDKTYIKKHGEDFFADDFKHECFAVAFPKKRKEDGLVIFVGCSHIGINNIIRTVEKRWFDIPILGVIGGFHLMKSTPTTLNCSESYVRNLARELKNSSVKRFYTCHCTGTKAYDLLADTLMKRIAYFSCGEQVQFDNR